MQGRCLCGAIRFDVKTTDPACVNCHCETCRRQCSAPMTTYIATPDGEWRWMQGEPKIFRSSPGVERTFCRDCGTPLSFRSAKMSGVMHFYVAAMELPEVFQPSLHVAHEEKLPWLNLGDELPVCIGPDYTKA